MARLYLQGWTQAQIAAEMGLSRQQVGYDLAAVRREWLRSAVHDIGELKVRELARLDHLERTYWKAWHDSRRDQESRTAQTSKGTTAAGDATERTSASLHKQVRDGNPEFLKGVQRCIAKRCEILDLATPQRHEHGSLNDLGGVIPIVDAGAAASPVESSGHDRDATCRTRAAPATSAAHGALPR